MYHVRMLTGTPGWRKPLTRACVPCSKPWLLSFRWRNVTMIFGELFCLENCLHGKTRLFCDYIFVSWDSFCATGRPNFLSTICCSTISRSLYGFSCITLKVPIQDNDSHPLPTADINTVIMSAVSYRPQEAALNPTLGGQHCCVKPIQFKGNWERPQEAKAILSAPFFQRYIRRKLCFHPFHIPW